jgi:hypothetical protein
MAQKTGYKDKIFSIYNEEPPQVECLGCKSDQVLWGNCKDCQIRKCAKNKMISHCALDCTDFPCSNWTEGSGYPKEVTDQLPHLKIIPKNLKRIKCVGVVQWLAEQEQLWKCPECQTNFAWYTPTCIKCGKDLEQLKDYNNV